MQGPLVDQSAARDVDEPRSGLDHRQGLGVDHLAGLGSEWRRQHDEVGLAQEFRQRLRSAHAIQHQLAERAILPFPAERSRARVGAATDRDDPTAERGRERTDRAPDGPESHDPDGHVTEFGAFERLPCPLALEFQQLGQLAADREDHHEDVFGDGTAEDAACVRHDETALLRRRRDRPVHARGRRVDPGQVRRADQQAIERIRRQPAAEHDLDVIERSVREPFDRDHDESSPGAAARIRSRSRDR